jgi:protein tyrosine phosphatase (PTP) superfamily phosphohydrolase (DUF442 family)
MKEKIQEPSDSKQDSGKKNLKKYLRISITAFVSLILICTLLYVKWAVLDYRVYEIDKGRVFRSMRIPYEKIQKVLIDYKIKTVIDLRNTDEPLIEEEKKAVRGIGLRYEQIPMDQMPSRENIDNFLKLLDDPSVYPVLIHCRHGIGRTGIMSAIYRIEYQKWDNDKARIESNMLGGMGAFKKDEPKGSLVMNYIPRWKKRN